MNKTTKKNPENPLSEQGLCVVRASKRYDERSVVKEVNLHLNRGEAVGLLGPNGAGKTTTFSMIAGLVKPSEGKVFIDGQDITETPIYQRARLGIGYLPQEASIFRGLSVENNIRAVLEIHEEDPVEREKRLDLLLSEFMIHHVRKASALTLSGGERRRVEIARALACRPNFILLDEPLAGIDPIAVQEIRELISHLKDRGIGVLITDHNVRDTLKIVDRAYILNDGHVLMEGTPKQIIANKDVQRVYLGDSFNL